MFSSLPSPTDESDDILDAGHAIGREFVQPAPAALQSSRMDNLYVLTEGILQGAAHEAVKQLQQSCPNLTAVSIEIGEEHTGGVTIFPLMEVHLHVQDERSVHLSINPSADDLHGQQDFQNYFEHATSLPSDADITEYLRELSQRLGCDALTETTALQLFESAWAIGGLIQSANYSEITLPDGDPN